MMWKKTLTYLWIMLSLTGTVKGQQTSNLQKENEPAEISDIMFNIDKNNFLKYSYKNLQLSVSSMDEPVPEKPDSLTKYNHLEIEGDHYLLPENWFQTYLQQFAPSIIYSLDVKDKNEFVKEYSFKNKESIANIKGDASIGARIGSYDNNFIRAETYIHKLSNFQSENIDDFDKISGWEFNSELLEKGLTLFKNLKNLDTRVVNDTTTSTIIGDVRSRTVSVDERREEEKGGRAKIDFQMPKHEETDLEARILWSQANRKTLSEKTTEIWTPSKYTVVPQKGIITKENTNSLGAEARFLSDKGRRSGNLTVFKITNDISSVQRDTVIVADSTYENIFLKVEDKIYEHLLIGASYNQEGFGFKVLGEYETDKNNFSPNGIAHLAYQKEGFTALTFLEHFSEEDFWNISLHLAFEPDEEFVSRKTSIKYLDFQDEVLNQNYLVSRIYDRRKDLLVEELDRAHSDIYSSETGITASFGVGKNSMIGQASMYHNFKIPGIDSIRIKAPWADSSEAKFFRINKSNLRIGIRTKGTVGSKDSEGHIDLFGTFQYGPGYITLTKRKEWTYNPKNNKSKDINTISISTGIYF